MSNFLSRYSVSFVRSLVYMLQQSEYDTHDYLDWFGRTRNFKLVARRKQLDMTTAARGFLIFLIAEIVLVGAILVWLFLAAIANSAIWVWVIIAGLIGSIIPELLAYSLVIPVWVSRILIKNPMERARIAKARAKLADHPATKIAIAGSFGKTTMKEILADVLGQTKAVAATPGNMNTPAGISRFVEKLSGNEEILIFELGEYYPGDIARLCHLVQPDFGIITGVNEAHLSKFKSLDKTVATIFELGDYLGSKATSKLFVNGESELAAQGAEQYQASLYSRKGVGEWKVIHTQTGLEGTSFTLERGKDKLQIKSELLGLHQVGPLAAAAVLAKDLDLSSDAIEQGVTQTQPFEHRLNPTDSGGVTTIDDTYNGNPDGARVAIEFLAGLKGHKRYYVTPGLVEMGHRNREVHETIGRQLAKAGVEVVVLIENSVMPYIKTGLESGGFKGKLMTYPDEISALVALPKITTDGDVVLLQNDWGDQYA